jgi:hypothetical protein
LIDDLDRQITGIERELRRLGANHDYVRVLETVPGVAWVLGYTIAAVYRERYQHTKHRLGRPHLAWRGVRYMALAQRNSCHARRRCANSNSANVFEKGHAGRSSTKPITHHPTPVTVGIPERRRRAEASSTPPAEAAAYEAPRPLPSLSALQFP